MLWVRSDWFFGQKQSYRRYGSRPRTLPGQADNPLNDLIRQKGEETKKVIAQERTLACQRFRPHLWVSRLSGRVVILSGKGTRRNRSSPKIATTKMGNGSSLSGIDLT